MVIGTHVESSLREKIKLGEYVDFTKLLPREKSIGKLISGKLELINCGGQIFFVPADRSDSGSISSFHKWEQAFI